MDRPVVVFDREHEWDALAAFVATPPTHPSIALVYGRRRQGKSFLLDHLARLAGGAYYPALEEERAPALARITGVVAQLAGRPNLPGARFDDWQTAFDAIVEAAAGRTLIVDEFPYLLRTSPELPSIIQHAFDAARSGRRPSFHLILCGSAPSVMSTLLAGQRALRGRVTTELLVRPFDFRTAREFWGIGDTATAFLVHAVVGGTPGYRDLLTGPPPRSTRAFAGWLASGVLDPSHALFREAEYLLTEDPGMSDRALYQSVVAAIASGSSTRTGIANDLRRPQASLDHPLRQLARSGFVRRDHDLLRPNRPLLRIDEPLVRFQFAVVRPDAARFEARRTAEAWAAGAERFRSQVLGPHFEQMARDWTASHAAEATLGGTPRRVGFAHVNDRDARAQYELDVVVEGFGPKAGERQRIIAIGEAKGGDRQRTRADLARLVRLRSELATRTEAQDARLLLFGRSGFHRDLRATAAARGDVELIDLDRMYEGE